MATQETFWTRRIRWRLIGAWRWPLFFLFTFVDAVIVVELPPWEARPPFVAALVMCSFGNLFLIGAVAPWLGRRIAARHGMQPAPSTFPPANHLELLIDKIASALLAFGAVGLLAAGLAHRPADLFVTERQERATRATERFVSQHAPPEIRRNMERQLVNTHPTDEDGFFRICVTHDDYTRAWCMFVDAKPDPPVVRRDPDTRPNQLYFGD